MKRIIGIIMLLTACEGATFSTQCAIPIDADQFICSYENGDCNCRYMEVTEELCLGDKE